MGNSVNSKSKKCFNSEQYNEEHAAKNIENFISTSKSNNAKYVFLFIRHAFSCANYIKESQLFGSLTQGFYFPAAPLTSVGINQSENVGKNILNNLKSLPDDLQLIDATYSSNLPRAIETAYYINKGLGRFRKVVPINGVKESGSSRENIPLSYEEYKQLYPQLESILPNVESNIAGISEEILKPGGLDGNPVKSEVLMDKDSFYRTLVSELKSKKYNDSEKVYIVPIVSHGKSIEKYLLSRSDCKGKIGNLGIVSISTDSEGNFLGNPVRIFQGFSKKEGKQLVKSSGGLTHDNKCIYGKGRSFSSIPRNLLNRITKSGKIQKFSFNKKSKSHKKKSKSHKKKSKSHKKKTYKKKSKSHKKKTHKKKTKSHKK